MIEDLVPKVCGLLGVKVKEDFKVKIHDNEEDDSIYYIGESGDVYKVEEDRAYKIYSLSLKDFLNGDAEIVKLSWKPKEGEKYWTFDFSADTISNHHLWEVSGEVWANFPYDIALYKAGWVYRTEEEANAALPIVAKECGVKYYKCSIIHGNGDSKSGSDNNGYAFNS